MRWDYVLFVMFLYPVLKGIYFYFTGQSEEVRQKIKIRRDALTKEKRLINSSLRIFLSVIPYFGAYYFADFKYFWLVLGMLYLLVATINLVAALGSLSLRENNPEMYVEVKQKSKEDLKNVNFWPKWQVHALCAFNITVLALWFYSWRYLFA